MVGGQDELVFDGDSIIVDRSGRLLARGPQFEEALVAADLELPTAAPARCPAETPVDARDGTMITVRRLELADVAAPSPAAAAEARAFWPPLPDLAEYYAAPLTAARDHVRQNHVGARHMCP